ncbi:protein kinase domain-containing protein [Streptomyces rubiginosohelvolus]|uniref:protein kinase domain-containing protein n=1 Tax=Streptomyces rubiginosohelvolus TaxID=67362 RepID=UPI0036BC98EA
MQMRTGRHTVPVPQGYRIGTWEVDAPLASGTFTTVYAAHRTHGTPRTAALKFWPTHTRTPHRPYPLQGLIRREVELLRHLRSPRLIRLYDTLTAHDPRHPQLDGATALVLERADSCLHTTTTPPTSPDAILTQICEGLTHLHDAGWIHGDLKPANILVMTDGTVRLADFNTAARLEGTHAYAPPFTSRDHTPPEQLWPEMDERGTRVQPSVDTWAFGVLAHTLLTGAHPLPGTTTAARCDAATRYARETRQLQLSPALPPTWQKIIRDCLARTPADRPDTRTLLHHVRHASHHL